MWAPMREPPRGGERPRALVLRAGPVLAGGEGAPAGQRANESKAASRPAPVATQAQADRAACSRNGRASCQSGAEQAGIRPPGGDCVSPAARRSARYSASGGLAERVVSVGLCAVRSSPFGPAVGCVASCQALLRGSARSAHCPLARSCAHCPEPKGWW